MIKYFNKHANEYSLSYKWIVNGIHALNLNLSLPTLTEMVHSIARPIYVIKEMLTLRNKFLYTKFLIITITYSSLSL